MTSTLAERYNREATRLMPHMSNDLQVDPTINKLETDLKNIKNVFTKY